MTWATSSKGRSNRSAMGNAVCLIETPGHETCVFRCFVCLVCGGRRPGGGNVRAEEVVLPSKGNQQDVPTTLPAFSPRRWKRVGSSGGRPTRTTRCSSPLPAFSPRRWKRGAPGCEHKNTHCTLPPPHHFGGRSAGVTVPPQGRRSVEGVFHGAIVIQLFRCCWWLRWCRWACG
jgi:hypothetical protein